jgi:hypothetical protein
MTAVHGIKAELKPDTVVLRMSILPADPEREVKSNLKVSPEIAFGQGEIDPLSPVVPTLEALCDFVGEDVIAKLSQFL